MLEIYLSWLINQVNKFVIKKFNRLKKNHTTIKKEHDRAWKSMSKFNFMCVLTKRLADS